MKTLDLSTFLRHDPVVADVRPLRQAAPQDDVLAQAEAAERAGSPAAATALVTAAAEDVERDAPLEAAALLAEGSWYAVALASDGDGGVAMITRARLGDALQWDGRYGEARSEWLQAAAIRTAPEPRLLCTRTNALLRAGDLTRARESAYAAAARARDAGDRAMLHNALTFQVTAENAPRAMTGAKIHAWLASPRPSWAALYVSAAPTSEVERPMRSTMRQRRCARAHRSAARSALRRCFRR